MASGPGKGTNKANQRQHHKRKGYYTTQRDKTPANKLVTWARHVVRFSDRPSHDRLRQQLKINLHRAALIAKSPRVKKLLQEASN